MGIWPDKWWEDLRVGAVAFLAIVPPLWLLQALLLPFLRSWGVAPDPLPIFVLALGLGTLFYRTGRLTPSLALHLLTNLASFVLSTLILLF